MSYILDALRKSEEKRSSLNIPRQQQAMAVQPASANRRIVLPLLILTCALIATGLFSRFYTTQPVVTEHQANLPAAVSPMPPVAENSLPAIKPETPATQMAPVVVQATQLAEPASAPVQAGEKPPEVTPSIPVPQPAPAGIEQPAEANNIPSRYELPVALQRSLPDVKIEGHIYDSDPSRRMAFVNGTVRKEKQPITQSLTLQEITPDGVILSYQGTLFHIGLFEQ